MMNTKESSLGPWLPQTGEHVTLDLMGSSPTLGVGFTEKTNQVEALPHIIYKNSLKWINNKNVRDKTLIRKRRVNLHDLGFGVSILG